MPKFFFDTDDGVRAFHAQVGVDLPSVEDVPREALALLRELMEGAEVLDSHTVVTTVRDAAGTAVMRATLSLTIERPAL